MLHKIKASVHQAWSALGRREGSLYLLARMLERGSAGRCRLVRYHIVAQPVPAHPVPACRPSVAEQVREVHAGMPECAAFPRPAAVIAGRFRSGHACLMAASKGRFSGFLWLARGAYDEDEVHCRFVLAVPEISAWDFDVMVEPQFRIGRTFARLWDAANARLAAEHVRWSFSRISAFNPASVRAHGRLGIEHLQSLTFLCFGPLQITMMSRAPYLHLCWQGRNPPQMVLKPPPNGGRDAIAADIQAVGGRSAEEPY